MCADVILLNGTSSAGKSSLASALQTRLPSPSLHAQLDTFVDMFGWNAPALADADLRRACHAAGVDHFHVVLTHFARSPYIMIVDHLLLEPAWVAATRAALSDRRVHWIGVHCPLPALEARERARGNRRPGLAASQVERVHAGLVYDFEIDTSLASPEACADRLMAWLSPRLSSP